MLRAIFLLVGSLVLLALVFVSGVVITAKVIAEPEPHRFANVDTPDLWTSQPREIDSASQHYDRLPAATASEAAQAPKMQDGKLLSSTPVKQTAAAVPAPTPAPAKTPLDNTVTAAVDPQANNGASPSPIPGNANPVGPMQQASTVTLDQAQSCFARYRSYRVEDNTYQPFDGGPRRQCQTSGQTPGQASDQTIGPATPARPVRDFAAVQPVQPQPYPRVEPQYRNELGPIPPESIPYEDDDQIYGAEPGYAPPQAINAAAPVGSHEEWCFNRYRSYQSSDNSYQPFEGGPRRACQSPFG